MGLTLISFWASRKPRLEAGQRSCGFGKKRPNPPVPRISVFTSLKGCIHIPTHTIHTLECSNTHTHTRTHTHTQVHTTHTHSHIYTHSSIHTHARTHIHTHSSIHTHARTHIHIHSSVHTCTHARAHPVLRISGLWEDSELRDFSENQSQGGRKVLVSVDLSLDNGSPPCSVFST